MDRSERTQWSERFAITRQQLNKSFKAVLHAFEFDRWRRSFRKSIGENVYAWMSCAAILGWTMEGSAIEQAALSATLASAWIGLLAVTDTKECLNRSVSRHRCRLRHSSARLRPPSERLLKPSPQLLGLTLRKLPEALF
jgi:hypothetical protein